MIESISNLTPKDKELLKTSWAIVSKDMESLAVGIFEMIFEQAPDAKLMFAFMMKESQRNGSGGHHEKEKRSNEFTFHALRFIQVIESVIQHLDDPEELEPLFRNVGQLHGRHQEQLGFRSHYWSVFKECTLYHFRRAMRGDKRYSIRGLKKAAMAPSEIDSAIILWREVLRVMIEKMKDGLEANNRIRKANRETIVHEHSGDEKSPMPGDAKHKIDTIRHRHELSVIVPDFFMRRPSEDLSIEDLNISKHSNHS